MSDTFGGDFVSITDEDGNEFELELIDALVHNDVYYHAFIPADADEEAEELEFVILKTIEENGEELLSLPDSEEEEEIVYALFMERLFSDELEDGEPEA
ncbi:MAG: DUF1292 domain-containing protein [Oscillospiraceae bacterium]|nr:DUF1292 domain-containing protein [Oscillospiraceae bacterium]